MPKIAILTKNSTLKIFLKNQILTYFQTKNSHNFFLAIKIQNLHFFKKLNFCHKIGNFILKLRKKK